MFGITFQYGGLTTGHWIEDRGPGAILIGHGRFYPGAYRFDVLADIDAKGDLMLWKINEATRQMLVYGDGVNTAELVTK